MISAIRLARVHYRSSRRCAEAIDPTAPVGFVRVVKPLDPTGIALPAEIVIQGMRPGLQLPKIANDVHVAPCAGGRASRPPRHVVRTLASDDIHVMGKFLESWVS